MANVSLTCHAATPEARISTVGVDVSRISDGCLHLRYAIAAVPGVIVVPPMAVAKRTDGLWQTTCCELFVRRPASDGYIEYNFAPCKRWAAYSFNSYRNGMSDLRIEPPVIVSSEVEGHLTLDVVAELPDDFRGGPLQIGPTVVVETMGSIKSYWAIRHAYPERPDFHHGDCFALTLPPPSAA